MDKLAQLAEQLNSGNRAVRYRAIYSLAKLRNPNAVNLLAETLFRDDDREIRALSAKLLSTMDGDDVLKYLVRSVREDRHAMVRRAAVEAIGNMHLDDPAVAQILQRALQDRSKLVRRAAVQVIRHLELSVTVPELIGVLLGDSDGKVRWESAQTLAILADVRSVPALVEALKADDNHYVRYAAAVALGVIASDDGIDALIYTMLHDKNSYVRYAATCSVGAYFQISPSVTVTQALLRALHDSNSYVWHAAAENLWSQGEEVFPQVIQALVAPDKSLRQVALKGVLWMSAEFDEDFAPNDFDGELWGWWN